VINLEEIARYMETSPQAEIYQWLQDIVPNLLGRQLTKAEYADFLFQAYKTAQASFIDLPNQIKISDEQQRIVIDELRNIVSKTEEFKVNAPEVLRFRELNPLASLYVDAEGTAVPTRMRIANSTANGTASPFGLHGLTNGGAEWLGEDYDPAEVADAGTIIAAPISGKIIVGSGDDGPGNSLMIIGTGEYEGMKVRILHMGSIYMVNGAVVEKGQRIGDVGGPDVMGSMAPHSHLGVMLEKNGEEVVVPSLLLTKDESVVSVYPTVASKVEGSVASAEYFAQNLDMSTILSWVAPWDFAPSVESYYKDVVKLFYADVYNGLPRVMR
jgi:murein DD-endopeptidase MepM/ murein hydrolase activator NlpD